MARTTEQVRQDIAAEREELASALDELRGSLGGLKSKLPIVAGVAASAGLVLAGGLGATARFFARRGRRR
jgi:hypothetical protein